MMKDTASLGDNTYEPAIEPDLILTGIKASTPEQVLRALGERLYEKGYVREGYVEAVLGREREFPTGLPAAVPVAIPHTDAEHCRRAALAVGILSEPVMFGSMGSEDETLPVRLVFLLAVTQPKLQVRWLERLTKLFRDADLMRKMLDETSRERTAELLRERLRDGHDGSSSE
jgi:PTS system galactitol-specific IIA component